MAIKKSVVTRFGIEATDAYIVVTDISYSKDIKSIATYQVWINKVARDNGLDPIHSETHFFVFNIESNVNIVAQAYVSLKSRQDFQGSVDV